MEDYYTQNNKKSAGKGKLIQRLKFINKKSDEIWVKYAGIVFVIGALYVIYMIFEYVFSKLGL